MLDLYLLWGIVSNAVNICVHIFCEHKISFLLGMHLGLESLGQVLALLNRLKNCQSFCQVAVLFYNPTSHVWGCEHFIVPSYFSLPSVKWYLAVVSWFRFNSSYG